MDNKYLKAYENDMLNMIMKLHPDWNKDTVKTEIEKIIKERCENPKCVIDNNYVGETRDTDLLGVLDWIMENKPIMVGNGTLYKNQHQAINPVAKMLEQFLAKRKALKKEMFQIEDPTSYAYKEKDLGQGNVKKLTNSYYGGSGMKGSAFYSEYSGPATTLTARQVISTAEQMFEGMLVDNYLYINLTELFEFCEGVLERFDFDTFDNWIEIPSREMVFDRYYKKIINKEDTDGELLNMYLSIKTKEELAVLYYSNNIESFINNHPVIKDIIINIFKSVQNLEYVDVKDEKWFKKIPKEYKEEFKNKGPKDWNKFVNKEYFMDPNSPPDSIIKLLEKLNESMLKYVYAKYLSFDRIYRLQNFKRYTVTVIDTDSNILSLDTVIDNIWENVLGDMTFNRTELHNIFIIVNMITYVLTYAVEDILLYYGEMSNIPEEFRPIFNMKNEFFLMRLVIGLAKKRYISKIVLREGNLMNPPKSDVKGSKIQVRAHYIAIYNANKVNCWKLSTIY